MTETYLLHCFDPKIQLFKEPFWFSLNNLRLAQWKSMYNQEISNNIKKKVKIKHSKCPGQNFILKRNYSAGVTKTAKEIKFEGVWGELKSKPGFQRQSVTKYLRLTLVFTQNSSLWVKFNFYFSKVFGQDWQNFRFCRKTAT